MQCFITDTNLQESQNFLRWIKQCVEFIIQSKDRTPWIWYRLSIPSKTLVG